MLKKTLLLLFLFSGWSILALFSQSGTHSQVKAGNVTLKEFINQVEHKYGYTFMYSNTDIDDNQQVYVSDNSKSLNETLEKTLSPKSIGYEVSSSNKKIVLTKNETGHSTQANQQASGGKLIKGTITDNKGEPIIGASVVVKGSTNGTITDMDGKFEIKAGTGQTLQVTYLGYLAKDIKVGNQKDYTIALAEDQQVLDEIVVVGYGTMKKSDLTGAVSSVDTKDLATKGTSNPAEALQGKVAGVNILKSGGRAGDGVSVKIRGVNTFGSNEPLYIIDGFPGEITTVNPNDIESIEILKDAAAAAIYGSVAANGVIIITTKNGTLDKVQVDISSYVTARSIANKLEMLDANGYVEVHKRMYEAAGEKLPGYVTAPGSYNTNWQDEVFRNGLDLSQSVAVRGGTKETRFSVSGNLTKEKGIVMSNDYTLQNVRSKVTTKKNIFTVDANMSFSASKYKPSNVTLKEVYMISPLVPVYDSNNEYGYGLTNWGGLPNNVNVVADNHYKSNWTKRQRFAGSIAVGMDITKWLNFKTSYSVRSNNTQAYAHRPAYIADNKQPNEYPVYSETRTYWQEQMFDNLLNFKKDFGKHSVNAILGTSLTLNTSNWSTVGVEGKTIIYSVKDGQLVNNTIGAGFLDPSFKTIGAGRGGLFSGDGSKFDYNRMSYFGRINYAYDSRYLFQFTFRRDGSSKFGSDNRFGNFPSVALGWRITEESFFPENTAISNLKLRASWGKLGNEVALGYYDSEAIIETYNKLLMGYVQGNGSNPWPGSIAPGLENKELRWEVTESKNIGIDFGLLNNKLTGALNYFNNTTKDLLIRKELAPSAGLNMPVLNVGKMRNTGFEMEVSYKDKIDEFNYNVGMNFSTLSNKVLALANEDQILYGRGLHYGTGHYPTQTRPGKPIGAFYLYQADGIFQSDAEAQAYVNKDGKMLQPKAKAGDMRFRDVNGDGKIDDDDKIYAGTGMPKVEVNLTLGADYKGVDFSALIGSGWGHKLYNGNRFFYESMSSGSNFLKSTLNSWRPDNTNTNIPRAVLGDNNGNSRESTRFLESGDFIRLRQVQIGYTFPKNIMKAIRSERLRIYVSGENLLTWTKYDGIDPEFSTDGVLNTGVDNLIYPFTRSYVFGLQLTF